jgi:hypothetical protein
MQSRCCCMTSSNPPSLMKIPFVAVFRLNHVDILQRRTYHITGLGMSNSRTTIENGHLAQASFRLACRLSHCPVATPTNNYQHHAIKPALCWFTSLSNQFFSPAHLMFRLFTVLFPHYLNCTAYHPSPNSGVTSSTLFFS